VNYYKRVVAKISAVSISWLHSRFI